MAGGGLGMDFFASAAFFFFLPWLSNVSKGPGAQASSGILDRLLATRLDAHSPTRVPSATARPHQASPTCEATFRRARAEVTQFMTRHVLGSRAYRRTGRRLSPPGGENGCRRTPRRRLGREAPTR